MEALMSDLRVHRQELTPIHFLERAGEAYAARTAVVDGEARFSFQQMRDRARRLASALRRDGLRKGDRVAFLAFNSEPLLLAHFGVPLAGGVLVAINTRLNAEEISYIVEHSAARMVFFSQDLAPLLARTPPQVKRLDLSRDWEPFLETGSADFIAPPVESEDEPISINY